MCFHLSHAFEACFKLPAKESSIAGIVIETRSKDSQRLFVLAVAMSLSHGEVERVTKKHIKNCLFPKRTSGSEERFFIRTQGRETAFATNRRSVSGFFNLL